MLLQSSDQRITRSPDSAEDGFRKFSLRERFLLWLISWSAYLLVRLVGSTLRFQITVEEGALSDGVSRNLPGIYCFWHRTMIPCAYHFRNMQIGIMISHSFDGECIARTVEKLGFRPVRGSSSRGGAGALMGMRQELELGHPAVFTADGPRGPLYVAKRGPVLLAHKTGYKICCFHVAVERAWILKSWDRMMIPKPFSRAAFYITSPLEVPSNASEEEMEVYRQKMQADLDRARMGAEARVGQAG
ncbi:MAG TPA: lysophospholipid acyltransferase family protein [Candidatus Angelobacter sp.]